VTAILELSKVDGSVGIIVAAHNSLGTNHIYLFGSEAQKKKYIPDLATGKKLAAWGLTEPNSGSDAAGMLTTAVRDGNHWVLNGTKNFITNFEHGEVAVVLAMTDREKGNHGISAFVVEKGTVGFRPGKKENKLGLRASETGQLIMEDCRIPAENLLGNLNEGFKQAMKVLDGGRISIAALALGMTEGALQASIKYAKERKQFGKPIGEFQAIQFKLADMATELEAAKLLTFRAASMKDEGKTTTMESSMAKLYASEVSVRVANDAVQIFGGYGYIKDFPVEKFYRDVKLCTIGEGTSEIQRAVIAKHLTKK
jgi:alkylation response protein AidB-like acyl-CoA dehydrogenase